MAKELVKWQLNYGNHCWPTVFFENHDTTRMTSKVCPDGMYRDELSKLLAVMQMTFKGVPFVYQGQEIGMTNSKFESIDDFRDVESLNYYKQETEKGEDKEKIYRTVKAGSRDNGRTPMCWTAENNAGFTDGTPWIEVIPGYKLINVATEEKDENSVLNFYRKMIALRHSDDTLVYGDFRLAKKKWKDVLAYYRTSEKGTYYIEINLTSSRQKKPVCTNGFEKIVTNVRIAGKDELSPFEANVYKIR
ncbi:MAG: alpha-glucosidase, partial [Clostridia bacterium]|nr:alpha-glucosidase [Clostridia bacterium]